MEIPSAETSSLYDAFLGYGYQSQNALSFVISGVKSNVDLFRTGAILTILKL